MSPKSALKVLGQALEGIQLRHSRFFSASISSDASRGGGIPFAQKKVVCLIHSNETVL
jgi:hypothetical protein